MKQIIKTFLVSIAAMFSIAAIAQASAIDTQISIGYGVGAKLVGDGTEFPAAYLPISMAITYEDSLFGLNKYTAGVVFQHGIISYADEASAYAGQNVLAGIRAGLNLIEFRETFVQITADYLPYNDMQVTSDTTAKVNGNSYSHSSLTTYSGTGATDIRVGYISEITDGQFTKKERLRYGVFVGQISQPLTDKTSTVVTSSSTLAPTESTSEEVSIAFSSPYITFMGGFSF